MRRAFSKKFDRQMVTEVSKRFNIKGVVQMGDGSSCGIVCGNVRAVDCDCDISQRNHKCLLIKSRHLLLRSHDSSILDK